MTKPPIDLLLLGGAPWVLTAALVGSRMFPGKGEDGEIKDVGVRVDEKTMS